MPDADTAAWTEPGRQLAASRQAASTFGISLATTTGYMHEIDIKYSYSAAGWACGTKNFPLRDTARGVVADATRRGNR